MIFTAPTNKATKVLSRAVGRAAATTYSALGLRMVQDEDTTKMDFGVKIPYIPEGSILVVDEASMCSSDLVKFLDKARMINNCKVLYVGDPAQLPPVGEDSSPCWQITQDPSCRAFLKEVMRFDNQLLTAATNIRECLLNEDWITPLVDDHDDDGGVYLLQEARFLRSVLAIGSPEGFSDTKLIAWRNKTVDLYNRRIRESFGFKEQFKVTDRLLLAAPIKMKDSNQPGQSTIIGHIDDEVVVLEASETFRTVDKVRVPIWLLQVEGDIPLELSIPTDPVQLNKVLAHRADAARHAQKSQRRAAWAAFWEVKDMFNVVRYGYAMTAHRAQGSTYTHTFVDQKDILLNSVKDEAFRCLYVACTRATDSLITF